jgi:hypothetical protein
MNLTEFMNYRYENREDKDNLFGVGISDTEFRQFIIDYLLGEDWYVVDPLGQTQINEIALYEILEKYSKRYRKECKCGMKHRIKFLDNERFDVDFKCQCGEIVKVESNKESEKFNEHQPD